MLNSFRKVIADGDLILQVKRGWWPFGEQYQNYRNESEEVRLLKGHMDNAFMRYKELQHLFVVAQKNVGSDIELLNTHKKDNSEVEYIVPHEQSILEERDGIKYSNNNGSGKQQQQGKGNGQQQGNQNKQADGNNQKQQDNGHASKNGHGRKPRSLLSILSEAQVVM